MIINYILILIALGAISFFGYRYYKSLEDVQEDEIDLDEFTDVNTLTDRIHKEFNNMLKENLREKNLSKHELEQRQRAKSTLKSYLKEAAYGNAKAKKNVKLYIKQMLLDPALNFNITESTIDGVIPFNNSKELKNQDKFEIILYIAANYIKDAEGNLYGKKGFAQLIKDYDLFNPVKKNNEYMYDLNDERLDMVYRDLMKKYTLSFNDKLEILSQRIFEMYKGFGAVDMLFDTNIDEVAGGLSGIPKDGYEIDNTAKNLTYTYQSIWIMVGGIKMQLSCLSFGSQEELIRVVNNIYKYGANRVLSRKNPYVISTMKNGSRVSDMRPPFSNSYSFLARKFDSAPSVEPERLIKGNNAEIPITLIKWLIKGQRNIGITGAQGTGKSTMLKSVIKFIDPNLSLRVQEISAELNLSYSYPNRNIIAFQETETVKSQEGLNFQKKTSGDVNIIGEVAEATQANFVIQTAMVASLFAMFTHHAKTAYDFVMAIANNLLDPEVGIYREKKEAVEMAAKILNIDIHLENRKGNRYMERITEIVPLAQMKYPSERGKGQAGDGQDTLDFYKRQTDRELFETRNLVEYRNGEFVLVNLPSDEMMEDIKRKLTLKEEQEFMRDMEYIRNLPRKPVTYDPAEERNLTKNYIAPSEMKTVLE